MGVLHGRDGARHGTGTACGSHWVWTVLTWGGCLGRMMDVGKRGGGGKGGAQTQTINGPAEHEI